MLALVVLTGTWPGFQEGLERLGQTDTASYREIALAAPGLPPEPLPYQHAQRFWMHWLVGTAAAFSGLDVDDLARVTVLALLAASAWMLGRLLASIGFSTRWQAVLVAAWLCDPWCTRFYQAVPWMGADVLFVLGFVVVLLGVTRNDYVLAAAGLVLAAFGRQTALAVMVGLWLTLASQQRGRSIEWRKVHALAIGSLIAIAIFWLGGWYARAAGEPGLDMAHLTGLFSWLANPHDDKAAVLSTFLLRGIASQLPMLALLGVVLLKTPREWPGPAFWHMALLYACAAAQPLLAGPEVTGDNLSRLVGVAAPALIAVLASRIREAGVDLTAAATVVALVALFLGSMHHAWSWPGSWLGGNAVLYPIVLLACSMVLALAAWAGLSRREAGIGSDGPRA